MPRNSPCCRRRLLAIGVPELTHACSVKILHSVLVRGFTMLSVIRFQTLSIISLSGDSFIKTVPAFSTGVSKAFYTVRKGTACDKQEFFDEIERYSIKLYLTFLSCFQEDERDSIAEFSNIFGRGLRKPCARREQAFYRWDCLFSFRRKRSIPLFHISPFNVPHGVFSGRF